MASFAPSYVSESPPYRCPVCVGLEFVHPYCCIAVILSRGDFLLGIFGIVWRHFLEVTTREGGKLLLTIL